MIINGKERGFRFNVWASGKVGKLVPSGAIKDVMEAMQNDAKAAEILPQLAVILNTAFERHKENIAGAKGEEYTADIMTEDDVTDMTVLESQELTLELFTVMHNDSTPTVETEPIKTGKKTEKTAVKTKSR